MRHVLKVVLFMGLLHCGYTTSRVTATLYALHCGQPPWIVGVILSLYAFFPAIFAIHIGKWIDKVGVRVPIILSASMIAVSCALPLLLPYERAGIWPLYFMCVLAGVGFLFTLIAGQGLIGHLSNNKNRATAFTYQAMAFSLSNSIGPVIAGYIIKNLGYSPAFSFPLMMTFVGALTFGYFASSLPKTLNRKSSKPGAEKRGAFDLFRIPVVRNILIANGMVSMAWDLQSFMIPVYGTEIGLDAVHIGWLLSTFSASTFAVRLLMPFLSHYFKEWTIIIFVLLSAGACYLVFPISTALPVLFLLSAWLGASLGASQPNVMSLLHQKTPDGRIGEANGIRAMIMNGSHTIFPLLFGLGGTFVGAAAAFWTLGSVLIAGGIGLKRSNKKIGMSED